MRLGTQKVPIPLHVPVTFTNAFWKLRAWGSGVRRREACSRSVVTAAVTPH